MSGGGTKCWVNLPCKAGGDGSENHRGNEKKGGVCGGGAGAGMGIELNMADVAGETASEEKILFLVYA